MTKTQKSNGQAVALIKLRLYSQLHSIYKVNDDHQNAPYRQRKKKRYKQAKKEVADFLYNRALRLTNDFSFNFFIECI